MVLGVAHGQKRPVSVLVWLEVQLQIYIWAFKGRYSNFRWRLDRFRPMLWGAQSSQCPAPPCSDWGTSVVRGGASSLPCERGWSCLPRPL